MISWRSHWFSQTNKKYELIYKLLKLPINDTFGFYRNLHYINRNQDIEVELFNSR